MRGLDLRDLAAAFDAYASRPRPSAPTLHGFDLVFAKQELDALGVLVDNLFLARQHRRPVERELLHVDAEFLGVLERVVDFGVVQKDFRGDAADVQASAAQKAIFFNDYSFEPPLRGPNRGVISSRAATDDGEIVFGQACPPRLAGAPLPHQRAARGAHSMRWKRSRRPPFRTACPDQISVALTLPKAILSAAPMGRNLGTSRPYLSAVATG